ncbi:ComEC/Rec2 family competence protein [Enterococcus crotali]|uniref:ComEC/Rec2 family competence protein n=1 Tax=Enterococcus crotali TaxID=1453587 RepID=UPI001EF9D33E|nr:hypothetical protein [Enterococcus crotali]
MVVYAKTANKSFLFTGDLEREGEKRLIEQYPGLKVDVLKAGHHGSKTSSDSLFIQKIDPENAVISCGRNNRFKHPHEETLTVLKQANIDIFQTNKNGMIYYEWTPFSNMSSAKIVMEED